MPVVKHGAMQCKKENLHQNDKINFHSKANYSDAN